MDVSNSQPLPGPALSEMSVFGTASETDQRPRPQVVILDASPESVNPDSVNPDSGNPDSKDENSSIDPPVEPKAEDAWDGDIPLFDDNVGEEAETESSADSSPDSPKPFSFDPFHCGDLDGDAVPEMPFIPFLGSVNHAEIESLRLAQRGWTVLNVDDKRISQESKQETENVFYAAPDEVVFIDGSLGFDHIDLRCFEVKQATFQNNTIIVSSPNTKPITIRYRDIRYAVFSGEVMVDL